MPRWKAVQLELWRLFGHLKADKKALDGSRVLRLVGTVSSAAKAEGRGDGVVREIFRARVPSLGSIRLGSGVIAHDFDVFASTVLPIDREDLRTPALASANESAFEPAVKKSPSPGRSREEWVKSSSRLLVPAQLAWDRLADLRSLLHLRGWEEGAPPGERNMFVYLGTCFLAQTGLAQSLTLEARELALEFAPAWTHQQVTDCIHSVKARFDAARRGEVVDFNGRLVSPLYVQSNEYLIEFLSVTMKEQQQLKTIIGKDEKRERDKAWHAAKRRAEGRPTLQEQEDKRTALRSQAIAMKEQGATLSEIAEALNIGRTTAFRYCQ
jgi:hypothetical protein